MCDQIFLCSHNMMIWHILIGGCKSNYLPQILIKVNLIEKICVLENYYDTFNWKPLE